MDFRFFIILSVFGFGMSYLTWMYYKGTRMQQHAYYLIFTLLLFSYKLMLPHFLFISAWVFYAGYNFTIYYNIIDQSGLSRNLELNIFQGHQDGVGLIRFENDISNPH
ncbi:MAG: hypothetical protein IPG86_01715 [Chitinophagaceae bacterium]|nr:hypothetical protein [Chitinophagaceae bacterium]